MVQLIHFSCGLFESLSAEGRDFVNATLAAIDVPQDRLQETVSLQAVKERVERSGADAIAVMGKLLHHGETEDGLVRGVHQHVDANKSEEEFPLLFQHRMNIPLPWRFCIGLYRKSIYIVAMMIGTDGRTRITSTKVGSRRRAIR